MLKSQLEPSPQNYETTSMFVENIFDTVKKAKAAKAAKSLAESKLTSPYQYPYDDPPPVKKKRPRKNAKKNGKVKKPLTPKKKPTTPRKPRILKDDAEKRKKATPVKSPRKYTKRVTKVPAPTDIDDEEAAFILSSISQRSFDSFYNRLNSCGSNKIHIPLDLPSLSVQNHTTESVKNQAYYVMLDHNYWVAEPQAKEVPTKAEVVVDVVKSETIQHHSIASSTETQPKNGMTHVELPMKAEIVKKQEIVELTANEFITKTSNEDTKVNEVNNNKVLKATEKTPEKEKVLENENIATIDEKISCNNTSVKKRWLRQAASEIKSPPKKRKNVEVLQVDSKRRLEDLTSAVCINKPEEVQDQAQIVKEPIEKVKDQTQLEDQNPEMDQAQKETPQTLKEMSVDEKEKIQVEVKVESELKEKEVVPPLPDAILNSEEVFVIPPSVKEEIKKEQVDESDKLMKDVLPVINLPASEPVLSTPVKIVDDSVVMKEEKSYDSDECDKRSWEIVMDFHRKQLRKLTTANNRYSDVQSTSEPKRDNLMLDQKFSHFDSLSNQYVSEASMHFHKTRSPFSESPFSLLRKPDFVSTRKTSLTIDANQYSLVPPAFQRSVSDISLLDTRRTRWRGNETAPPSFYSNSIPSFTSLGAEHFYNKHEPYSKTNYSSYRAQKALCVNSHTPDPAESLWEVSFDANKTLSDSFLTSFINEDNITSSTENAFKRAAVENNIPRKNLTAIAMTKTKTAVSDPRLNPSLQHDAKKEESAAPKKKLSLDQYRKRVSLTSSSSSSPPEETLIHSSPAFDPSIAAAAANG